jgi:zinc transporter ZupT
LTSGDSPETFAGLNSMMEQTPPLLYALILFLLTIGSGLVALFRPWSEELLHAFVALGAGLFLGAVFLHLLPEAMSNGYEERVGVWVLAGFLLVLFAERIVAAKFGAEHSHVVVSLSALVGLSVHSVLDGLSLVVAGPISIFGAVGLSMIYHKLIDSFALGSLLALGSFKPRIRQFIVVIFAALTPLTLLFTSTFLTGLSEIATKSMQALAAGTFLYIGTCQLLPEAFHTRQNRLRNLLILVAGMGIVWLLHQLGHEH